MEAELPQVQEVTCEIVVTRADGTVEDLGVVSRTVYEPQTETPIERFVRKMKEALPWQT